MKKLMALVLIFVALNAYGLEDVERQRVELLKGGEYNISISQQTNLNKLLFKGKDFVSFKYSAAAEKILSSEGLIAGVDFQGTHSSDDNTIATLNTLDFRAGGAVISNDGNVAAFFGTVGLRSDTETKEQGSVFAKGGGVTSIENRLNLQFGARIAFYAKVVEGHMQIVLLPMIDEYELESQLAIDFREFEHSLEIADSIIFKSKLHAGIDRGNFEGLLSILFSINMNWGVLYFAQSQFNFDFGPEIIWDKSGNPNVRFYLGVRARL